jgi:DNA-binding response OmpR family regulator
MQETTPVPGQDRTRLEAGKITLDLLRHEVRIDGHEVELSQREFDLLAFLVRRGGHVASADEISQAVWGGHTETNTVTVYIRKLRRKLGDAPSRGRVIRTVRGIGYRMAPEFCPHT